MFFFVDFSSAFWAVTRATNKRVFEVAMESIKAIDVGVSYILLKIYPKHWLVHAFDINCESDDTTGNMIKSFNAWLGET